MIIKVVNKVIGYKYERPTEANRLQKISITISYI